MRRPLIDISSIKDTILMPPPKLPYQSLQSITSDDFQRPFFNEYFNTTSTENTIITALSKNSTSKNRFLQRKRSSFQDTALTEYSDEDAVKNEALIEKRCLNKIKFKKLPIPYTNKLIEFFVMNMIDYLNGYVGRSKTAMNLKAKILLRYEDYQANGLEKNYYLIALSAMQNELIALICQDNDALIIDDY